ELTLKNLSFPFKVLSSLLKANKILSRFKPDVVVGVGGYASGPILAVASFKKIPTLIQEQNSYAGITNKILGKRVDKICVAYDGMEKFFSKDKLIMTGNPVRQDILNLVGKKGRALEHFELDGQKKTLLIIGGSLGARTINQSIIKNLELFKENNIQIIWQTGKSFFGQAKQAVELVDKNSLKVFDFIGKMDLAYAIADVVISRAGASSVSELCLVKKPAILVPSPNVAEDHQTKNTMALVTHNAAIMIKDVDAVQSLSLTAIELLNSEEKQQKLAENIAKLAFKDSAGVIASEIINLVKKK
ncbi:MAG: UDP-N-acetylglucosamine--N-acetylmuramyl-(pentapeptide) pyrophosphoryl-undecaprenol N-acetylglucosamine transferase, partial [Bacteroidota bacterium]|nr:UDP-N-acetylglucosamine--N-acetylmuramyl-(pentapeptide) pyrophosphoryl-undecaprenol N-acetylglucosamine transferase [Bacteroidota bacterium]